MKISLSIHLFFLIAFSLLIGSCKKESPLHHLIHETDVVSVYIYSGDQLAVKYVTNDQDKIKDWDKYIGNDSAATGNCTFEGRLVFKVYEDSTEMKFSLQPGCQRVEYSLNGTSFRNAFTTAGIEYLEGLKKIQ